MGWGSEEEEADAAAGLWGARTPSCPSLQLILMRQGLPIEKGPRNKFMKLNSKGGILTS